MMSKRLERLVRLERIIMLVCLVCLAGYAAGQETATHILGLGSTHILDTYLSQEKYKGDGLSYLYIREHARLEKRWNNVIEHELDFSTTEDRSKTTTELEASYNLYWGRYRSWRLLDAHLHLQAGGLVNGTLGFIYHTSNSNNPAQARAAINLMPSGIATYDFHLGRQRFIVRYELNVPLLGVMFSPNYGQSYYEIFSLGNYDHNIVPTTFISAPTLRQQLSLDWRTGDRISIRIGYLGNYQQAAVNNLKQHVYAHRFLIGITKRL